MINILPPDLKNQIYFSKRNVQLVRYNLLALIIGAVLIALLFGSMWYANRQIDEHKKILAERQQARTDFQETETRVTTLQSNLLLIEKLFTEQTRYSALLRDLAAAMPRGAYINQVQLLGTDKEPLELLITTDTFDRAAEVRNALVASDRIANADIQSISAADDGDFSVIIIAAFEGGQAR